MPIFKEHIQLLHKNHSLHGFRFLRFRIFIPIVFFFHITAISSQGQDTIVLSMDAAVQKALANNDLLKNAELRREQNSLKPIASWNLSPTEVNYKFGQIYSSEKDAYLEINQNFGSLLTHLRLMKQADVRQRVYSSEYMMTQTEISAQVKSVYFFWIYTYAISRILEEEKNIYSRLDEIAAFRYKKGEITLLNKTVLNSRVAEKKAQYLNALDDIRIAENQLHQLLMDTSIFKPNAIEPELYKIAKETDTSAYNGMHFLNYYDSKYALAVAEESVVASRYFPEIKAGFFTQDITGAHQLYGGQIGMTLPLWIPGKQADRKVARINSEIAMNEVDYQRIKIGYEVENLLLELNKYFRQIRYYQVNALPQAELLVSSAMNQLDAEEIEYSEYLESISMASEIKRNYYQAVLNYNQTAIQLELYAY